MRRTLRLLLAAALAALVAALFYAVSAYEFVPGLWRVVERRHPAFDLVGTRAFTAEGIPGDPLNVAFVGDEAQLCTALRAAGWHAADPITWRSSLRIAADSVEHRPYDSAPVSSLYVLGRRQDLAFEAQAGNDPSRRHHVRFWRLPQRDLLGRELWIGAATYDKGIGLSHTTGQLTHHIAPAVDAERDKLLGDLAAVVGQHLRFRWIDEFQPEREGRNGGGDRFQTDGRLALVECAPGAAAPPANGAAAASP